MTQKMTQMNMFPINDQEKTIKTLQKKMGLLFSERSLVQEEISDLKKQNEHLWEIVGTFYQKKTP